MKTIALKPTLNPAFKMTQLLPRLPADFVAKRAWPAQPFSAVAASARAYRYEAAATSPCTMRSRTGMNAESTRLVA